MKVFYPTASLRCAWIAALALGAGCAAPSGAARIVQPALGSQQEPTAGAVALSKTAQAPAQKPGASGVQSTVQKPAALASAAKPTAQAPTAIPAEQGQPTAAAPAPVAPVAKAKKKSGPLTGSLSSRYKFRAADGDSDQDIYEVLALDYADPAHPELEAHFLGRGAFDIDGDSGPLFSSINDSRREPVDADVFEGYAQLSTNDGDTSVRIGRQSEYLAPEIAHFDGASLHSNYDGSKKIDFGVYGGNNVTYDHTSNSDNAVFGAFAESRAWKGGRARLDWLHLNDDQLLGDGQNDLIGAGLWQAWKNWNASGKYTSLESRNRDIDLRTRWSDEEGKTSLQVRYFQLLEEQNQRALFLDPYSQALQTYYPYQQIGVSGWHALTEKLDLDAGIDFRDVNDPGDVGTYNHDWNRYYATLTASEILFAWTASVTADYYDDEQSDYSTLGGDFSRKLRSDLDVSLGTYYSLYKYDFFTATERDDVRSYYGKLVWRRDEMWSFEFQYEYEDDDLEQYHTVRCGALCRF